MACRFAQMSDAQAHHVTSQEPVDAQWQTVVRGQVHVYSAFRDDRRGKGQIVVIASVRWAVRGDPRFQN